MSSFSAVLVKQTFLAYKTWFIFAKAYLNQEIKQKWTLSDTLEPELKRVTWDEISYGNYRFHLPT